MFVVLKIVSKEKKYLDYNEKFFRTFSWAKKVLKISKQKRWNQKKPIMFRVKNIYSTSLHCSKKIDKKCSRNIMHLMRSSYSKIGNFWNEFTHNLKTVENVHNSRAIRKIEEREWIKLRFEKWQDEVEGEREDLNRREWKRAVFLVKVEEVVKLN